jgi:hypothetical protein
MNITVLDMNWTQLAEVRNKWRTLLKLEMKLAFHNVAKLMRCLKTHFNRVCINFFISLTIIILSFPRTCGVRKYFYFSVILYTVLEEQDVEGNELDL